MTGIHTIARLALTYLAALALGFLVYLVLIRSPLLDDVTILFYRGIVLAGGAALVMLGIGIMLRIRLRLDPATLIGATALSLAFNLCFLIVFPVTFDRSITMFLLARIEQRDGQLDTAGLEHVFAADYLGKMRQIDRRVEEQQMSGNIQVVDSRIWITPQGKRLMRGARTIGGWFGADPRFVDPDNAGRTRH
jgi:hypothetical protein